MYWRSLIFFIAIIFLLYNKPISLEERELKILYVCNVDGKMAFDNDGRKGLATLAELKRRELESLAHGNGNVFLFANGSFMGNTDSRSIQKGIEVSKFFDGVFLNEVELSFLETNYASNLESSNLLSHRENSLYIPGEKVVKIGKYKILFSNISKRIEKKLQADNFDLTVVFLPEGEVPGQDSLARADKPVIYIYSSNQGFDYTFLKNHYFAECPNDVGYVGRLTLHFREGRLIRNSQDMIPLNTIDHNNSWIDPDRKILHNSEK